MPVQLSLNLSNHKTYWERSTVQAFTERCTTDVVHAQFILRAPNYRFGRCMPVYSGGSLPHMYTPRAAHVYWSCTTQVQRACMLKLCARRSASAYTTDLDASSLPFAICQLSKVRKQHGLPLREDGKFLSDRAMSCLEKLFSLMIYCRRTGCLNCVLARSTVYTINRVARLPNL